MTAVRWRERWACIDAALRNLHAEMGNVLQSFHVVTVAHRAELPVSVVRRVGLSNAMLNESMRARYLDGRFYIDHPPEPSSPPPGAERR
ncbi:MAG TPA: hypothetical protein VN600_06885 [Gemmatimonadaceae bacterium]|nr:hypothetical protein [Gemmatimonadaceae bacterium]